MEKFTCENCGDTIFVNPKRIRERETIACMNCGDIITITPIEREGNTMKRFWVCWVEGTDGGMHYRHYSLGAAQDEAERLAQLPNAKGKMVYLYECIGKCYVELSPVIWEVPRWW